MRSTTDKHGKVMQGFEICAYDYGVIAKGE